MLTVLSPAKTLDFTPQVLTKTCTTPEYLDHSEELVAGLRKLSRPKLKALMHISDKLTDLNHERYREWASTVTDDNAKPALLAFRGDVYTGFELDDYGEADFKFAQKHLRILSGLYGVLRPLDLIQAYRLEMGTGLKNRRGEDLYAFWDGVVTDGINEALAEQKSKTPVLVNLASNEYFSVIREDRLEARVVTPVFKDFKNGKYKFMSFYGKKARGMMADYIIRNRIDRPEDLVDFGRDGYYFDEESSEGDKLVFLRDEVPAAR